MAERVRATLHWKQLVVRIRVPLANGKVGVGTGLLISRQHVLTSWHVVAESGALNDRVQLDLLDLDEQIVGLTVEPEWHHAELDIALLKINRGVPVELAIDFVTTEPKQSVSAEMYGFARGSDSTAGSDERFAHPFKVTALTPTPPRRLLELAPADPDVAWEGMSGAPIVFKDRILGVVSAKNDWAAPRLIAVPISRVHEALRKAAGLDADASRLELRGEVTKIVSSNDRLHGLLAKAVSTDIDAANVADRLIAADARDLVTIADTVRVKSKGDSDCQLALKHLLQVLLPCCPVWRPLVNNVRSQLESLGEAPIAVPLATEVVIECLTASVDGRACAFSVLGARVVGKWLVPTGLECGADVDGSRFVNSVLEQIYFDECNDVQIEQGTNKLIEIVGDRVRPSIVPSLRVGSINKELERRAQRRDPDEPPLYVILCARTSPDEEKYLDQIASRLAGALPLLRIYRMSAAINNSVSEEINEIDAHVYALYAPPK